MITNCEACHSGPALTRKEEGITYKSEHMKSSVP